MSLNNCQIAIIDFGMGNLFSVKRACEHVGLNPLVTSDVSVIMKSDAMILPGVGAFGDAMDILKRLDLIIPIKEYIGSGRPFMGICLGLQLLMSESEEFGHHAGLDIIKGRVVKFPTVGDARRTIKVPQVGWNRIYRPPQVSEETWRNSPIRGILNREYMYFVHSYYTIPDAPKIALTYTDYEGTEYTSSILLKNIFACQFHPEKSSYEGMKIYKNFAALVKKKKENNGS